MDESRNDYTRILLKGNRWVKSEIECEKCGSQEVQVVEKLVKSADESCSLFITCKECGHVACDHGQ
jgi:DNA-directed RNA polymerase subunit M/transcription elongation factor TFIIS